VLDKSSNLCIYDDGRRSRYWKSLGSSDSGVRSLSVTLTVRMTLALRSLGRIGDFIVVVSSFGCPRLPQSAEIFVDLDIVKYYWLFAGCLWFELESLTAF